MKHNSDTTKPKNHTLAHSFVMVLTIVLGALFISGTVSAYKWYSVHANAHYVKEYATIVRYETHHNRYNTGYNYTLYYEYEADGMVYSGIWERLVKDEEVAKAKIGKPVAIYVDHDRKIHSTNAKHSPGAVWFAGTLSLACCLTFLNSFIREIIYIVRWKKYKKALHIDNNIEIHADQH